MVKKSKVSEVPDVAEVAEVSDVPEVASEEPKETLYMVGEWRGLPQYVCAVCGFDAFFEIVMLRHLVNKHNSEMALARLLEIEEQHPEPVQQPVPPSHLSAGEEGKDVFEVELVEMNSTVDAQGNEHKNFVIKE